MALPVLVCANSICQCNPILNAHLVFKTSPSVAGIGLKRLLIEPNGCAQEQAQEETQKYKEGKFIIEKAKVLKVSQL